MKNLLLTVIASLSFFSCVDEATLVSTAEVAGKVMRKGLEKSDIRGYEGSLLLQGIGELSLATSDDSLGAFAIDILERFGTGEIKGGGSFYSYEAGGNAAALLNLEGHHSLREQVVRAARKMMESQPRSSEGLIIPGWVDREKDQVFIDMAFAVTPFLLYAGLVEDDGELIDQAVFETLELFSVLKDNRTNLLHQCRGFVGKGILSEDNWSRGNGWGALAIAALVERLPKTHPQRERVEAVARDFFTSLLEHQDGNGLWHQEITEEESYAETSGSGLILYGLGKMIESEVLGRKYLPRFKRGLSGLLGFVAEDGSVSNASWSCLCPGDGTKEDYAKHPSFYNDSHSFGPVVLALVEALNLGIDRVEVAGGLGHAIEGGKPRAYVRHIAERKGDIAWENDRVAFRIYSKMVESSVGSGVDLWTKSVDRPVIDNWYSLNDKGLDYHTDRGEGYDFYSVGKLRGCGGSGVWGEGGLSVSRPYSSYCIERNDEDLIAFRLDYDPYDVDGARVRESKEIRMVNGTNFYQVTALYAVEGGGDLLVAVGLTSFGNARVEKDKEAGSLSLMERISEEDGCIGTCVIVDPGMLDRFETFGQDELVVLRVSSGAPFTYYVGAGWSKDKRFDPFESKWRRTTEAQSFESLNETYMNATNENCQ